MMKFDELAYLRSYFKAAHRAWIISGWSVVALSIISTTATWTGYDSIGLIALYSMFAIAYPFLLFFFNYTSARHFVDIDREAITERIKKLYEDKAAD